jgi:hypothetical protein
VQVDPKWGICKPGGQLLLSDSIDAAQAIISWFRPDAPGKTKECKIGPLPFQAIAKADALLAALAILVPSEFKDVEIVEFVVPAAAHPQPAQLDQQPSIGFYNH